MIFPLELKEGIPLQTESSLSSAPFVRPSNGSAVDMKETLNGVGGSISEKPEFGDPIRGAVSFRSPYSPIDCLSCIKLILRAEDSGNRMLPSKYSASLVDSLALLHLTLTVLYDCGAV